MFGIRRKKTVELVPFAESKPQLFSETLCDGLTAYNLRSTAELLALHARLQQENPNCRVLASLDDLGQACYTSGHSTEAHRLDDVDGHDLSMLGEEVFEEGKHRGYLSTQAEFPIRLANLLRHAEAVDLGQVAGVLDWETEGDANDLVTINRDPEQALGISEEKEVLFQYVPVETAANAIAAFPNGYFRSDLNPMQNHALARHLETKYGLMLFGIGARFLGFRRKEALNETTASELATELCSLYAGSPPEAAGQLAQLLTGRAWLLVRYTES